MAYTKKNYPYSTIVKENYDRIENNFIFIKLRARISLQFLYIKKIPVSDSGIGL